VWEALQLVVALEPQGTVFYPLPKFIQQASQVTMCIREKVIFITFKETTI
jgi:hypothetical protein